MENSILMVPAARTIPVQAYTKTEYTEVVIPEGVEIIEPKAFQYCSSLRRLHLPRSLRYIELKAFEGCPLEEIFFAGMPSEWEQVEISPVKNNTVLTARKRFALSGEAAVRASRTDRSPQIYAQARELLENGGDGRLHVFVPELMIPGSYFKYGDLTLLIFPHGSTMVIDAGRDDCHLRTESFLDAAGVCNLDYLVFSHACPDHVAGGPLLIKHIWKRGGEVRRLWWTGQKHGDEIQMMVEMLRERGAETDDAVRAGRSFEIDGIKADILGPTEEELQGEIGVERALAEQVAAMAKLAKESGLDGVVASAKEIKIIREACGEDFVIVTPGIRPRDASLDDQKRVKTPGEAIADGADYLVIGRPITKAENRAAIAACPMFTCSPTP